MCVRMRMNFGTEGEDFARQSRSSTHDSHAPAAAGYTNHPVTTTALVAAVSAAPSALRVARSAALDPSPPAIPRSAAAP